MEAPSTIADLWLILEERRRLLEERDHRYEERFTSQEKANGIALASAERAVSKAEASTEKRFDDNNEYRGQLKDQAATFVTRTEINGLTSSLAGRVAAIETFQAQTVGGMAETIKARSQTNFSLDRTIAIIMALIASGALAVAFFRAH
jgi:hypothetical protein